MRTTTMQRLVQSIQLLKLDGYDKFTTKQLAQASGVSARTIERGSNIVDILTFALNPTEYDRCYLHI